MEHVWLNINNDSSEHHLFSEIFILVIRLIYRFGLGVGLGLPVTVELLRLGLRSRA